MIGTSLNHFRITSKLGQGGMGEVYRAADTRLGREVAIKVLPATFTHLPGSTARFEREAKTLAALNHPGIASVHGFEASEGRHFLIMELVEGETLEERLRRGALPIEEALEIGRQIAEALESAHASGIIHRDLKPGNVKITPGGRVKLLDFGLAKALVDAPASADNNLALTDSPTLLGSVQSTIPGVILGTAAYMSPEQARGKPVDERSDIWSFGVVLSECLTGRKLFAGESVSDILAAVLRAPIDWEQLPRETPISVRLLLRKCLSREPRMRLQHIGDARVDLEQAITEPELDRSAPQKRPPLLLQPTVILALGLVAMASAALGWLGKPAPRVAKPAPRHFEVSLTNFSNVSPGPDFALSPDGRLLVYGFGPPLEPEPLRIRALDTGSLKSLAGTETGYHPFFSPDNKSIGFVTRVELKVMPLSGGPPLTIAPVVQSRGAAWAPDGRIVFAPNPQSALMKVSSAGGAVEPVTKLEKGELSHRWPQFLPDGKHLLFMVHRTLVERSAAIHLVELATGQRKVLKDGCLFGRYVPSGHMLFVIDSTLFGAPFDLARLEFAGLVQPLVHNVRTTSEGGAHYAFADDGTLAYLTGSLAQRAMMWLDADGKLIPASPQTAEYEDFFRLSPDDRNVAVRVRGQGHVLDLSRNILRRYGSGRGIDTGAIWSPDGQWLIYGSVRNGKHGLWRKRVDFSADEEMVIEGTEDQAFPAGLTPDGKSLLFSRRASISESGFWQCSFEPSPQPQLPTLLFRWSAPGGVRWAQLSPDGKWLAYTADDGQVPQLYIRPFQSTGAVQQISTFGASPPQWSKDGQRVFYSVRRQIFMTVAHPRGDRMEWENPVEMFELPESAQAVNWHVASDGKRALVIVEGGGAPTLNVVPNWFTELEQKLPVTKR